MPLLRFKNFPLVATAESLHEHLRDCLKRIERAFVDLGFTDSFRKSEYREWGPFNPNPKGSGTMVLSAINIRNAEYKIIGKTVEFSMTFDFTTAGAATTDITARLPLPCEWTFAAFGGNYADAGLFEPAVVRKTPPFDDDEIVITRYDNAVWGIGTSRRISIFGKYKIA